MGGVNGEGEGRMLGEERVVSVVQQNTCLDGTATQCLSTQVALFNSDHLNF